MRGAAVDTTEQPDRISTRIVEAVAREAGADSLDLDRTLHEVLDTDALDALYRSMEAGSIAFDYLGYRVTVHHDGHVTVEARAD